MKRSTRVLLSSLASLMLANTAFASPTKAELDAHKKIVGYFPEWGVYSAHNNYAPSDTPFDKLTHINYAFARIIDGKVAIFDDWAATGITFGEAWDSEYKGNLGQFKKFKKTFPDTSVLISVGGWTQSAGFHDAALTEANRKIFADSCVDFIRQWDFDGVDIDWEFPTQQREPDLIDNANDTGTPKADAGEKQTFTLLLKAIREALDKAGEEDGKYYQLTAAVGASVTTINNVETDKYHQYLDFINIMSYDMHGAWEKVTNHQSALFSNPNIPDPYALTIDNAVRLMKEAGVPSEKIVIGSPYYSRGWKGVKNDGNMAAYPGLNATATGGANGIWDGGRAAGVNPYYHIKANMETSSDFVKYRDEFSKVPYLYSESKGEMYTYEDEVSIGVKAEYVNDNSLGGVIFWELSADYPSKGSTLTNVLFDKVLHGVHPRYANEELTHTSSSSANSSSNSSSSISSSASSISSDASSSTSSTITIDGIALWSASDIYVEGDKVYYNDKVYVAKWWNKGNSPNPSNANPWREDGITTSSSSSQEVSSASSSSLSSIETSSSSSEQASSASSDTDSNVVAFDRNTIYVKGDYVSFEGAIYMAKWWTKGEAPLEKEWGPWQWVESIEIQPPVQSSSSSSSSLTPPPASSSSSSNVSVIPPVSSSSSSLASSVNNSGDTYDGTKIYVAGDRVIYNGVEYEAQWWNQGEAPQDKLYTAWKKIGTAIISSSSSSANSSVTLSSSSSTLSSASSQASSSSAPSAGAYQMSRSELEAKESTLTSFDLMAKVKDSIRTIDNVEVEKIQALRGANPSNVRRVESIISEADWEYIFAKRSPEYTYENFLKAVGKFPAFCGDYSDGRDAEQICRTSLATMFAHFTQETGGHTSHWEVEEWRQGLVHVREMGWNEEMRGGYNGECNPAVWQGQTWPCGTFDNGDFKSYFGRGAKQLSYNYNYGPFSEAMTGSVRTLLDNPELVADTWYNLASAVFFFTYPQPPKPSMLHVIDGTWQPNSEDIANGLTKGFGVTTQIINGGVECGGSVEVQQSVNRIDYYRNFAAYLNVTIADSEVLGCKGMKQFSTGGNGALEIYWEQDWGYDASKPEGKAYACKLVGYQTPYSAFKAGDYAKCVDAHFDIEITE